MLDSFQHLQKVPEFIEKCLLGMFSSRNERLIKKLGPVVQEINAYESELQKLDDTELKAKTPYFKNKLKEGESLDEILPEVFAVVREASVRTIGLRHYDVQMIGGILLHQGNVTEMMTGEGKTLVATCPAYLNALTGGGVHLITVNDYLASRDSKWMGEVHEFLGLSVGCIQSHMEDASEKRKQYECDITYGTNNEFGFDYLRDNMKAQSEELVMGPLNYAIIDEVDSILIDEARTPLIISGPAEESDEKYIACNVVAKQLKKDEHFTIDEKETGITLTEAGISTCEEILKIDNLYSGKHIDYPHYLNNALRAHHLFRKDKDYVTQNGEVVIVDEHTGRLMSGRRWSDGLHQAVEVKEGMPLKRESQTLASITFQNLFKIYDKISGMTGTAMTESSEFLKIYKLDVVAVPSNRPCLRIDEPDLVFGTQKEKYGAIAGEIEERHKTGQPVLVGTASIESSEIIGRFLTNRGIPHEVLNAKQHEREALIVAQAGRVGAVTVATNMAGRGTDIVLGGNSEVLIRVELGGNASEDDIAGEIKKRRAAFMAEQKKVVGLGGLYVLGTERHESRRIDNQLRGRSARQGDPGESRFYLSLEDDLMRRFAPPWAARLMQKTGLKEGEAIEHSLISKSISNAQKKVEEFNFDIRKNLLEYDEVMNEQRKIVYKIRNKILIEEGLKELLVDWVEDSIRQRTQQLSTDLRVEDDPEKVKAEFQEWAEHCFVKELPSEKGLEFRDPGELENEVLDLFKEMYEEKEKSIGDENCRMAEKYLLLSTIDHSWKEHLYNMDHVKDAIGWRGYAQVDPKVEYKKEGYRMFLDMLGSIKAKVTEMAVRLSVQSPEDAEMESVYKESEALHAESIAAAENEAPQEDAEITKPIVNVERRVGRNDPCPCGSGKKFKACCG